MAEAEAAASAAADAAAAAVSHQRAESLADDEAFEGVEVTDEEVTSLEASETLTGDASAREAAALQGLQPVAAPLEPAAAGTAPEPAEPEAAGPAPGERWQQPGPARRPAGGAGASGVPTGIGAQSDSDSEDDGGPGLSGFQDVLSSWATAAAVPRAAAQGQPPSATPPLSAPTGSAREAQQTAAASAAAAAMATVRADAATTSAGKPAAEPRTAQPPAATPASCATAPVPIGRRLTSTSSKSSHSSNESCVAGWLVSAQLADGATAAGLAAVGAAAGVAEVRAAGQQAAAGAQPQPSAAAAAAVPDWLADSGSEEGEVEQGDDERQPLRLDDVAPVGCTFWFNAASLPGDDWRTCVVRQIRIS